MSDFAWTLIDIRTLRTLFINIVYFIKKMCAYWEGINVVFLKDESRRDGWHFSVICRWCARAGVAEQGREISILSQLRTELVLHLT